MDETDTTEPTREELLELLASLEARTGVMIGPPPVARRYRQLTESAWQSEPDENALDVFDRSVASLTAQVVESFVDLGDGDSQTGVAAIMGSPPYTSAFGIEGPPLRERVVSVDRETGFGFEYDEDSLSYARALGAFASPTIRIPAEAPESVAQHGNAGDAVRHLADWMRTRITPGADPRAEWSGSLMTTDPNTYRDDPHTPKWYEVGSADRPVLAWVEAWNARGRRSFTRARYVPCDVLRWRDPEHRATLTARAREYASHLPGRRS